MSTCQPVGAKRFKEAQVLSILSAAESISLCQFPDRSAKCTGLIWAGSKNKALQYLSKSLSIIVTLVAVQNLNHLLSTSLNSAKVPWYFACVAMPQLQGTFVPQTTNFVACGQACNWRQRGKERKLAGWDRETRPDFFAFGICGAIKRRQIPPSAAWWRIETKTVASEGISC